MFYKQTNPTLEKEGVWDEKSCVRRIGGYDLDKSNLPTDLKYILKGAALAFDKATGNVKLVKTAKVYAQASTSDTSIKIEKGGAVKVGDKLNGSTVTAIDKASADYDLLTVDTIAETLKVGDVITDGNEANVIGLNYYSKKIEDFTSVTVTLQAYEIQEETLPYPVNDAIKTALTVRHAWKID